MVWIFKLYRYLSHRLATYQVLAALFFGCVCALEMIFINYSKNPSLYQSLCAGAGFLLEYAVWVKLMFMFCLTFHLFSFAVFHADLIHFEIPYVIVSIGGPLLFCWVPFIHSVYGQAGAWCWIQNWKGDCADNKLPDGEIEEYSLLYGPAFVGLSLSAVAVFVIVVVLLYRAYCNDSRTKMNEEYIPLLTLQRKKALREILPLVAYPILFIIFFMPSFVNRIRGAVLKDTSLASFMWSAVTTPMLSFFAGLTLILHIAILECQKRFRNQTSAENQQPTTQVNTTGKIAVFTTQQTSGWEPLAESDLD